jgi:hypothetical protein
LWFSPGVAVACHFFIISAISAAVGCRPGPAGFPSSPDCENANDAVMNATTTHVTKLDFRM